MIISSKPSDCKEISIFTHDNCCKCYSPVIKNWGKNTIKEGVCNLEVIIRGVDRQKY